ncbi:hypothetical protein [Nodosilinea sp. PGN35]|uniref:hypothetical protein n=1 Tax=Nodosilinea sp. PGN35 TaxID=3020489 RepID=UPI0023B28116|nr:hypothetical protein [Nodosilinea sp. TSF1-S3]MDF0365618.1 hypothetical protein [Nodosilinea sp. TSF1-S3]
MEIGQLKSEILTQEPRDFVEKYIVQAESTYITEKQIRIIQDTVSKATGIGIGFHEIAIVGSAKLGFGLFEKRRKEQASLPAFRPFDGNSDIDIAFISPLLFDVIWDELAAYAIGKPWMPHRMHKLGDYLVYGWIRPDHVPREARLRTYDTWQDSIRGLTASTHFDRRKLSGALYRDLEFLIKYQARGIARCKAILESS